LPKKSNSIIIADNKRIDNLYKRVAPVIREARAAIMRTVDTVMVNAYWNIGKHIVEEEQRGAVRADYGKEVLNQLSKQLSKEFGRGFGVDTLEQARKFYLTYQIASNSKSDALRRKSKIPAFNQNLSWTHYRLLMRVSRSEARLFYQLEASKNNWSSRELDRQIGSLLFDRLAKSKDKEGLMRLAQKGQEFINPADAIKEPVVLEFLGIPEAHQLVESKLEEALISNLQHFLLEMGKGFAFVARQNRLTLDGKNYYTDLVFYHTILKCYVIIDIKTRALSHADLGQMLFYVNYYDKKVVTEGDNPTIGLILCTEKSEIMVQYTLGEKNKQVFTSKYQFHLPTEQELEAELKREIKEIKQQLSESTTEEKSK
jgi:predicted nuclease of restriction endonuclease-like (RecB) superfamily